MVETSTFERNVEEETVMGANIRHRRNFVTRIPKIIINIKKGEWIISLLYLYLFKSYEIIVGYCVYKKKKRNYFSIVTAYNLFIFFFTFVSLL